ncbi:MAG: SDR family NAD(P)-dependent oxidoreductase, partial [Acidimicrobiales bacterium]
MVLVTGGSKGIGAACAAWFAANGDRVAATTRGPAAELEPPDGVPEERFMALRCDVTDAAQVEQAFAQVEARWGPVEVLVANAGITKDVLVVRMDEDAWHDVIETNLTGAFRVARRAVAKMLRLHHGRIVFVSSVGAFVGLPGQANYAASKAGLVGMARALAREVASRQITV